MAVEPSMFVLEKNNSRGIFLARLKGKPIFHDWMLFNPGKLRTVQTKMFRSRKEFSRSLKRLVFYFQTNICCSRSRNETNVRRALKYFSLNSPAPVDKRPPYTTDECLTCLRITQWITNPKKNLHVNQEELLLIIRGSRNHKKRNRKKTFLNFHCSNMMKTLTMSPSADESLRMLSPQDEIKSTQIQEILSINNENGNVSSTNASADSRWAT